MKLLNATAHNLTQEQLKALENLGINFIDNLRDINPKLYLRLIQAPDNFKDLHDLAVSLNLICEDYNYIHFPISSPVFMFIFALYFGKHHKFLFSHTKRITQEKIESDKIIKETIFKFEKFIII